MKKHTSGSVRNSTHEKDTVWSRLNSSRNLRELYGVIDYSGAEKAISGLLGFFCVTPVIMSVIYCIVRGESVYDTLYMHEGLFAACSILLLAVLVLILTNEHSDLNPLVNYSLKQRPWLAMLAFLLPWSILCAALSVDRVHSFFGTDYSFDGVLSYFFYAAFFVGGMLLRDEKKRIALLELFGVAADVTAIIVILEGWEVPVISTIFGCNEQHAGCFTNSNHAGYYLCTSAVALSGIMFVRAYESRENVKCGVPVKTNGSARRIVLYSLSLAMQFYALFINDTLGSMLAAFVGIVIVLPLFFVLSKGCLTGRSALIASIPAMLFTLMIILDLAGVPLGRGAIIGKGLKTNVSIMNSDVGQIISGGDNALHAGSGRLEIWIHYFKCFIEHPIFGLGPEGLEEKYTIFLDYWRPHNEYLIVLTSMGLPGFIAYMGALITVCVNRFRMIKILPLSSLAAAGTVVCYLISAIFGNTKFYTYPYFMMLFGMVCSEYGSV